MHDQLLFAATLLATTANKGHHLSVGPWIIVPILIVAAIIAIPIYIVRDRRKRRETSRESHRPPGSRR
jgi:4-hydroxybenzoate polyprenyltransferase